MTRVVAQLSSERDVVVIQRNPTSGTGRGRRQLVVYIRTLRAAGFTVRCFTDRDALDAWVSNFSQPERLRCVVAAGGDGTLSNVAQRHSTLPLATLPMGTENLFSRHLGIPRDGRTAAQAVIGGRTAEFDTATVNGQRFLIMASVGVDGEVVRRLSTQRTGNINHLSYAKPVLQSFLRFSYPELIASDGNGNEIGRGSHIIVANLPEYGFRMPFAPMATPHDAALDVAIFSGRGVFATAWHALKMRLGFSVEGSVI